MFPRHQYISASAAGASSENIANQPCLNESGSRKICYGEERIWFIPGVYFSGSESCFFSCGIVRPGPTPTLDVCGITTDGRLWYTSHLTLPSWLPFINVQAVAKNAPGHCAEVSMFGNGQLDVFVQSEGVIWHTARSGSPDFQWQPEFDNIESQAGSPVASPPSAAPMCRGHITSAASLRTAKCGTPGNRPQHLSHGFPSRT